MKVSSEPKAAVNEDEIDYNAALRKFFERYAPEKLSDTENYLQKYRGKEAEVSLRYNRFCPKNICQIVDLNDKWTPSTDVCRAGQKVQWAQRS